MTKKRAAFEVVNLRGFHARPATLFVQCAEEFASSITVRNVASDTKVDGKSVLSLLTLFAPKGSLLEVTASGADAEAAVRKLGALIMGGFDEE